MKIFLILILMVIPIDADLCTNVTLKYTFYGGQIGYEVHTLYHAFSSMFEEVCWNVTAPLPPSEYGDDPIVEMSIKENSMYGREGENMQSFRNICGDTDMNKYPTSYSYSDNLIIKVTDEWYYGSVVSMEVSAGRREWVPDDYYFAFKLLENNAGFRWWIIVVVIGVLLVLSIAIFCYCKKYSKKKSDISPAPEMSKTKSPTPKPQKQDKPNDKSQDDPKGDPERLPEPKPGEKPAGHLEPLRPKPHADTPGPSAPPTVTRLPVQNPKPPTDPAYPLAATAPISPPNPQAQLERQPSDPAAPPSQTYQQGSTTPGYHSSQGPLSPGDPSNQGPTPTPGYSASTQHYPSANIQVASVMDPDVNGGGGPGSDYPPPIGLPFPNPFAQNKSLLQQAVDRAIPDPAIYNDREYV